MQNENILEEDNIIKNKSILKQIKEKIQGKKNESIFLSEEDEYNYNYVKKKGGYEEFSSYAMWNNKYYTSIRVHSYNEELQNFWLTRFAYMPNVSIELEIEIEDKAKIKKGINTTVAIESLKVQKARTFSDRKDAYENIAESQNLYSQMSSNGNGINSLSLNLIVYGETKSIIKKTIENVKKKMKEVDLEGNISMNNQMHDLKLIEYKNYTKTIVPSHIVKTFFPFNFQEVIDPKGMFLGSSKNGGQLVIDHTRNSKELSRLAYDILIMGKKGYGKSALIKSIVKKEFLNGNNSIFLDPEGEYTSFVRYFGGTVIDMNNKSIINPLEFRTGVTKYTDHLANLRVFLKLINPEINSIDLGRFIELIEETYELNEIKIGKKIKDTDYWEQNEFPIFEDVYLILLKKIKENKKNLRNDEHMSLDKIKFTLKTIVDVYGEYFNEYTTLNVESAQMISFNLKALDTIEENAKNSIIFNILQVFIERKVFENKEYNDNLNPNEENRLLRIILEEAHVFLNEKNHVFVDWFKNAIKRFRKNTVGSMLASQNLLDYKPINDSKIKDDLTTIFEEGVYKYFLFQDFSSPKDVLDSIGGLLTREDLETIKNFSMGEFLLLMPKRKILGYHTIDKFEKEILFATENRKEK